MGKNQEELTAYYNSLCNEELDELLAQDTTKYAVIRKSSKVAHRLMAEWKIDYTPLYQPFIRDYLILLVCAKRRGLSIPKELMQYEIDNEDVIERLMEEESIKIKEVDSYIEAYQKNHIGMLPVARDIYVKSIGKVFDYLIEEAWNLDLTKGYLKKRRRGTLHH